MPICAGYFVPLGHCCSPSYLDRNDDKYRCSETGYRIPLKCIEIQDGLKGGINNRLQQRLLSLKDGENFDSRFYQKTNKVMPRVILSLVRQLKWRRLLDTTLTSEGGKQSYITYRSCLPAQFEEKLSVLGFEKEKEFFPNPFLCIYVGNSLDNGSQGSFLCWVIFTMMKSANFYGETTSPYSHCCHLYNHSYLGMGENSISRNLAPITGAL